MAQVGASAASHELSKRMLKGHLDVGGDDSKAKYFRS